MKANAAWILGMGYTNSATSIVDEEGHREKLTDYVKENIEDIDDRVEDIEKIIKEIEIKGGALILTSEEV